MELLGHMGHVESCFGPFEDGNSVGAARFAPNVLYGQKSFWTLPMVVVCDEAPVKARFNPFGDSANLDVR
jgi:hypothetical protein